jgi:hypothetical protein
MTEQTIAVPVDTKLFIGLVDFLREKGSDRDPIAVIDTAIAYWMENADWKTEDLMPEVFKRPQHLGYQWKILRLPPGTKVRMKYKGVTHHASVDGDDFIYEGKKTTPSEFANQVAGGTARNAWRDLWIKRPEDRDFRLADDLRRELARTGLAELLAPESGEGTSS